MPNDSPLLSGKIFVFILLAAQLLCSTEYMISRASQDIHKELSLAKPLILKWSYSSSATTTLTPAVAGDQIYFPLTFGMLISLRAPDGQLIWRTELGGEISSSPVADEKCVYVASEISINGPRNQANGTVRAIGREGGITRWIRTLPMPIRGALALNDENLYGGASDGRVYAIKKRTGAITWSLQHSSPFESQPILFGSRLYVGSNDGTLFSLDQGTGRVIWRYQTRGAIHGRVVVVNGVVYFGSADGYVYAVRESDGHLRWRKRAGATVQTVAFSPIGLIAVSLDNFVYCLSFKKGDNLWRRQLAGRLSLDPLIASDGALFTPMSSSTAVVLNLNNGKQINSLLVGEDNDIVATSVTAKNLLILTTRNGILAFISPGETDSPP